MGQFHPSTQAVSTPGNPCGCLISDDQSSLPTQPRVLTFK
jgi:hypothetical protein